MQHVYQSPAFFTGSAATPLRTVRRADCQLYKFAHLSLSGVLKKLDTQHQGLSFTDVLNRLMKHGLNRVAARKGSAPDLATYAKLMSQQTCMVRRQNPVAGHEGSYQGKVSASLLVPGDMVLLGAGDWVPADVRLISQDGLVLERMVLQAWPDSCAMGDKVIAGTAQAVVVATGEHTLLNLLMQMPQQPRSAQEHHSLLASWRHSLMRLVGSCAVMLVAGGLAFHSTASHAETELSLYGTLDTGMSWTRISGHGHRTGLEEGGQTDSLWGLRGQEDLGGGTYATFRLEGGLNLLTGSAEEPDRLFNYQSWLGLSNEQWGELRFGRQYTVGQEFVSELEIAGWKDFGMGALMRASDNYQVSSAATWISPEWSGFQLGVTHSRDVGERDWEKNRKQMYSVAGRYENGPWQVAASFERLQRVSVNSNEKSHAPQALQLGLSYDFGSVRLATAWSRQQNGFVGRNGEEAPASLESIGLDGLGPEEFINGGRLDTWYLGAAVELGGGEVQMQWALGKPNWTWEDTGSKARKMQVMSLGYVYPLSPRTSVYAFAAHGKHYDPENVVTAAEPHSNRVAVGLTHHF